MTTLYPVTTLYDVLGVPPDSDDETLKKAFRKAVKAAHPDLHVRDPDALLRFRQIVIARDVLRDAKQRAVYNRLLEWEWERLRRRSKWKRIMIFEAVAVAVLAVALVNGYTPFVPIPTTEVVAVNKDMATAIAAVKVDIDNVSGQTEIAAVQPAAQNNTTGRDEPLEKREGAEVPNRVIEPTATAPATNSGDVQVIADERPALGLASNNAQFYRERGMALYRSDDFARAVVNFDEAIGLDPHDAQAYNIRGNAWDEMGLFELALADYDEAIRLNPNNPAVFHDRAILWRRKGALDKALVDFDRAIRFSFSDANIYCDRGLVWYEKGQYDRAVADFKQAIKIDPNLAVACINRGVILHRHRDLNLASATVKRAIRIDPSIFEAIRRTSLIPELR